MAKVRRPFDVTHDRPGRGAREPRRHRPRSPGAAPSTPRAAPSSTATLARARARRPLPGAVGNFVYVDVGEDAGPLFERLLREGVIVRPLHGFGAPTAIRVSVGTPEEHDAASRLRSARVLARGLRTTTGRRRSSSSPSSSSSRARLLDDPVVEAATRERADRRDRSAPEGLRDRLGRRLADALRVVAGCDPRSRPRSPRRASVRRVCTFAMAWHGRNVATSVVKLCAPPESAWSCGSAGRRAGREA